MQQLIFLTLDIKQESETLSYSVAVSCKFTSLQKSEVNVISESPSVSAAAFTEEQRVIERSRGYRGTALMCHLAIGEKREQENNIAWIDTEENEY